MLKLKVVVALVFFAVIIFAGLFSPAFLTRPVAAKPAFMDRYNHDPYSKAELRGKCTICHIGHGGGERNDFGEAFEDAGYRITPRLREKFPGKFVQRNAVPGTEKNK